MSEAIVWMADALVVLGLIVSTAAVYGMWWLPDLYTRLHAAGKAALVGSIPIMIGVAMTGEAGVVGRVVLVTIFFVLTTPVSSHVIARAKYLSEQKGVRDVRDRS